MSLLLLLNSSPAPNFTLVQKAWNSTAGGTPANTTLSFPSVGAGHLVCVSVEYLGTATGFTLTITDGNGHNFTLTPNSPFQYSTLARYIWLGYILSAAAGTMTITATPSVAHGVSIHAAEFSYTGTAAFDVDAGAFSTSGTTPVNTPSITPTNPNALLYAAAISDPAGSGTLTAVGAPWTDGTRGTIAADSNNSGDAFILGAGGTVPVSWTVGSSSATGWNAAVMAFNLTASPGALAGISHGAATGSATITGKGAIAGTAHGAATGAAAVKGAGKIAAVSHGTATATATVKGTGAVAVIAHGIATGAATLKGSGIVAATSHGAATGAAVIRGSGVIAAVAHGAATALALVKGSGRIAATSHGVATGTATVSNASSSAIAGTANGRATGSATVKGAGVVSGTAHGAATATATLRGSGAIAAVSHGVATATATLHSDGATQVITITGARVIFALQPSGAHTAQGITVVSVKALPALAISGAKEIEAVTVTGAESGI